MDLPILDFPKMFDPVPHRQLLARLDHYGVCSNMLNWIVRSHHSYSVHCGQVNTVQGGGSPTQQMPGHSPRTPTTHPSLYTYISELPSHAYVHPDTLCQLFADDCLLYCAIHTAEFEDQFTCTIQQDAGLQTGE